MLDFLEIGIDDIWEELKGSSLIKGVIYDGFNEDDVYDELASTNILAVHDGVHLLGFFSYEDLDCGEAECRTFVFPEFRKYSKRILEAFFEEMFNGYGFKRLITTVTSDYPNIVRFLSILKVLPCAVLKNFITKNGKALDVHVLIKEVG